MSHRPREKKVSGMSDNRAEGKQGEKIKARERKSFKVRRMGNGSRASDAVTVELADCEKPESPCRLLRWFFSAIMTHYCCVWL